MIGPIPKIVTLNELDPQNKFLFIIYEPTNNVKLFNKILIGLYSDISTF